MQKKKYHPTATSQPAIKQKAMEKIFCCYANDEAHIENK